MRYRRLGRSNLRVSVIGFGTCQLRRVPEQQAIDTLKRGFALGVNLVHTAPDYEGADDLVAQAVAESGRDVLVLTQGYGDRAHFEWLFESACRKLGKRRLEMFGVACIDDREYLGEPVWGPGGVVEFLQQKKAEGRLGATFCTTHGTPEYVSRLIASGTFDAIMLAYNALGFHLLSYHPGPSRQIEDIARTRTEIFPLAALHDVGLMIMKPFAGGLLAESKGFPPRTSFAPASAKMPAGDILRDILRHPEVTSVVPGTTSVEEAEENARAGHRWFPLLARRSEHMRALIDEIKAAICSRCGFCDALCSKHLPVSWLFRDAYITHYPSETFETADDLRYFSLHPWTAPACSTCDDVTCSCPHGIDVPASLITVHGEMLSRRADGVLPEPPAPAPAGRSITELAAAIVTRDIPRVLRVGEPAICRVYVQNTGTRTWTAARRFKEVPGTDVALAVLANGIRVTDVPVRHYVEPGARTHFVFAVDPPAGTERLALQLVLRSHDSAVELARDAIDVTSANVAVHVS